MGNYCCSAPCNSPCGEYANEVTMEENFNKMIREEDMQKDVDDGDILLFKANKPAKKGTATLRIWTEFDHIAIVLRPIGCVDDFFLVE